MLFRSVRDHGRGRTDRIWGRGRRPQKAPGKVCVSLKLTAGGPEGKDDEGCVDAGEDEGAKVEVCPADARRDDALADEGRAERADR